MQQKNVKKLLTGICSCIALVSVFYIGYDVISKEKKSEVYETLKAEKEEKKENETFRRKKKKEKEKEEVPIDFEELWKVNEDIYAWIEIPGTNINYPIVQSDEDDAYYLNHTIEGAEGYPGSIYTESVADKEFTDFNTVIYGHDMKDGSMFQNLHLYTEQKFMNEHPEVIIYTPEEILRYDIFAAVVYDNRHLMNTFHYERKEDREVFLKSVLEGEQPGNTYRKEVEVSEDDFLITLSTCTNKETNRLLVLAVLKSDSE